MPTATGQSSDEAQASHRRKHFWVPAIATASVVIVPAVLAAEILINDDGQAFEGLVALLFTMAGLLVYVVLGAIVSLVAKKIRAGILLGLAAGVVLWLGILFGSALVYRAISDALLAARRVEEQGRPPIWQYTLASEEERVAVSPIVTAETVYAGSSEGGVYALDKDTGTLRWTFRAGSAVALMPVVRAGVVYVRHLEGYDALDASTGATLWRSEAQQLAVTETTVYEVAEDYDAGLRTVRAIDARTWDATWTTRLATTPEMGPTAFRPTRSGDNLYLSTGFARIQALDAATGKPLWTFLTRDEPLSTPPAVSNGRVLILGHGTAYALRQKTGEKLWSRKTNDENPDRDVVVAKDDVWYVNGASLDAVDSASGRLLWSFSLDQQSQKDDLSVRAVGDNMVFGRSLLSESLFALNAATGEEVWSVNHLGAITSMTLDDGRLYAHAMDGYVHVMDAGTGEALRSVDIGGHFDRLPVAVSDGVMYLAYSPRTWEEGQESFAESVRAYAVE